MVELQDVLMNSVLVGGSAVTDEILILRKKRKKKIGDDEPSISLFFCLFVSSSWNTDENEKDRESYL